MFGDVKRSLGGGCGAQCRLRLDHTVSIHTHGARMASYAEGAASVGHFLRAAAKFATLAPLGQLAGQLAL